LTAGALANGSAVYATILTYPFTAEGEELPQAQRPNILARVSDTVNPISSSAFTTSEATLDNQDKKDLLTRFISAMYAANLLLNSPSKKKCAVAAIQNQLGISAATALLEYTAATSTVSGEVSPGGKFTVNQAGLNNVIAVREQFGGFTVPADFDFKAATVPGDGKLIDYSVRNDAVTRFLPYLLAQLC
jgi:hypothetical protein